MKTTMLRFMSYELRSMYYGKGSGRYPVESTACTISIVYKHLYHHSTRSASSAFLYVQVLLCQKRICNLRASGLLLRFYIVQIF